MDFPLVYSGKVRDVYDAGGGLLLMVASDRISAFDRVFAEPVPDKGRVLTAMTAYWSAELQDVAPTHLVATDPAAFPPGAPGDRGGGGAGRDDGGGGGRGGGGFGGGCGDLAGRAMLVRQAEMLPIECIVRGYLSGSAWKEYRSSGTVHGTRLPAGLRESERLPEPMFTPSTKATEGHDENISFARASDLVGVETAEQSREIALKAYGLGAGRALARGIVVADTKFELGFVDGVLTICDEILTPDSSRFWPLDEWEPGHSPPSFDKQPVRDFAEASGWDKESDPPQLPDDVVTATRERYVAAYELLTGLSFAEWWGVGPRSHGA